MRQFWIAIVYFENFMEFSTLFSCRSDFIILGLLFHVANSEVNLDIGDKYVHILTKVIKENRVAQYYLGCRIPSVLLRYTL